MCGGEGGEHLCGGEGVSICMEVKVGGCSQPTLSGSVSVGKN